MNMSTIEELLNNNIFEINRVPFVNVTPHVLTFDDGRTIPGVLELAKILTANAEEGEWNKINDIVFVTTAFRKTHGGRELVVIAKANKIILIGSIIAAQAYGFPVVSPISTPETSRLPPDQRIVLSKKFNTYPKDE